MPWELAADADRVTAGVVLARPLETIYHYLVPEELRGMIQPGQLFDFLTQLVKRN